jgi:hypothetical protein
VLAVALAAPALAEGPLTAIFGGTVMRETIDSETIVGAAGTIELKSVNAKRVFVAGGMVKLGSVETGEVVVAGGNVTVEARDTGSLELMGGNIVVTGRIRDDIQLAAGNVRVEGETAVGGDLNIEAGNTDIDATVTGETRIDGERVALAGTYGGDVRINASSVTIAPGTTFKADLHVPRARGFTVPEGVIVAGKVQASGDIPVAREGVKVTIDLDDDELEKRVNDQVNDAVARAEAEQDDESGLIWPRPLGMGAWLTVIATLAAAGALALAVAPQFVASTAQQLSRQPLASLGLGLGSLVVVPLALFLVGLTIVGIPLAVLGFAAYVIGLGLGLIALCLWGGLYVRTFANQPGDETRLMRLVGWTLMGFLALAIVGAIPFVGRWIQILAVMTGAGAVLGTAWTARSKKAAPA